MQEISEREKKVIKVTVFGTWVNLVLVILKIFAGIFGKSSAMIADAVHSLSDFLTDLVAIFSFKVAHKPKDKNHNYGHGKFETLGGLVISVGLIFVGSGILYSALIKIHDLVDGVYINEPNYLALLVALISIITKEYLFRYTHKVGKEVDSRAVIANAWEHRSDAFSSVGAFLGIGGAIFLGNKWVVLDPISALFIAILILKMGIKLTHENILELTEASLSKEENQKIVNIINKIDGVSNPHNLCTRKIGHYSAIDVHVEIDGKNSIIFANTLIEKISSEIKKEFGLETKINIHFDPKK